MRGRQNANSLRAPQQAVAGNAYDVDARAPFEAPLT
jgi:hypothetical protein